MEQENQPEDHPLEGDRIEVETGPPGVAATMSFAIPVVAMVRNKADVEAILRDWQGPSQDFAPIVARAVRNSFTGAEHGDVKVLCGPLVQPSQLHNHFTNLGLQHDRTPDVGHEESAAIAAKFVARHFDPHMVHEELGNIIQSGVEQ